jgi:hypothetical protein
VIVIALYMLLRVLLTGLHGFVRWRAGAAERRHELAAREADVLVRASEGKGLRPQLQALAACERAEKVESRYVAWQARAEALTGWRGLLASLPKKKAGYAAGALDVGGLLTTLESAGIGPAALLEMAGAISSSGWERFSGAPAWLQGLTYVAGVVAVIATVVVAWAWRSSADADIKV